MTDDDACPAAPARSPDLDSVQRRTVRSLVANEHFRVDEYRIDGRCALPTSGTFRLGTVVAGQGVLAGSSGKHVLSPGASFVLPVGSDPVGVSGTLTLILTAPPA